MRDELTLQQRKALRSIAKPLGFIFWGSVLAVLDFRLGMRVSDAGFAVDLLPDGLGLGLIAVGMGILAFSGLLRSADDTAVTISGAIFLTLCLLSIGDWFVPRLAQLPLPVRALLEVVAAAAVVAFCVVMARLANEFGLSSVARSWGWIAIAVMTLYTLPQRLVALMPSLTPVVLIASVALVIVLGVTLLRTTYRMRRMATEALPPGRRRSGAV